MALEHCFSIIKNKEKIDTRTKVNRGRAKKDKI